MRLSSGGGVHARKTNTVLQIVGHGASNQARKRCRRSSRRTGSLRVERSAKIRIGRQSLTAHLVMPEGHAGDAFLKAATEQLRDRFEIEHVTLQIVSAPLTLPCR